MPCFVGKNGCDFFFGELIERSVEKCIRGGCAGLVCSSFAVIAHTYLRVGAAAGDGVAAVAVGALGWHFEVCLVLWFCWGLWMRDNR